MSADPHDPIETLRATQTPDHAPDFWADLDVALQPLSTSSGDEPAPAAARIVTDLSAERRSRWKFHSTLVATAAAVIGLVAAALLIRSTTDIDTPDVADEAATVIEGDDRDRSRRRRRGR